MPLPTPKPGESKDDFVSRFMSSEVAKKEFPDRKQRVAVALNIWRRSKRKKSKHEAHKYQANQPLTSPISGIEYVVVHSVPVMDEHYIVKCNVCNGKGGDCPHCRNGVQDISVEQYEENADKYEVILAVDKDRLQKIADTMNRRIASTNDFAAITIGHTQAGVPEIRQPPVVGHAKNFSIKPIRETHNQTVYALVCDFYILKEYEDVLLRYPRKSVEYNIEENLVDPIALLGASTPARQVGWIAFGNNNVPTVMRYSAMSSDATSSVNYQDLVEELSKIKNELQEYKDKCLRLEEEYKRHAEVLKKYEEEVEAYMKKYSSDTSTDSGDGSEAQGTTMNAAMPGPTNVMVPTYEEYQKLQNELNTIKQQYTMLQRKMILEELKSKHGIELSVEEELEFTKDMSDEKFQKYVDHAIKRHYSKRPIAPENTPFVQYATSNSVNQEVDDSKIEVQDQIAKYALRNNISYMEARAKVMEMLKQGVKVF
jgi:hypothetical protein